MNRSKVLRGTVRVKEDMSVRKRDEECQLEFERWSEEFLILFYLKDGEREEEEDIEEKHFPDVTY